MIPVIPDTCIWIDFIHKQDRYLSELLRDDRVIVLDVIIGEIAVGNLRQRARNLKFLRELDSIKEPDFQSTIAFIERHQLFGIGLSWVDAMVLNAARLAGVELWTRNKRVASIAEVQGFAHIPAA